MNVGELGVSYFLAAFARANDGAWVGVDGGSEQVESLEGLVEFMHDTARASDEPVVCFLEENDEWFALVRVDGEGEPRVFISDLRAPLGSELAAMIYEGVGAGATARRRRNPPARPRVSLEGMSTCWPTSESPRTS